MPDKRQDPDGSPSAPLIEERKRIQRGEAGDKVPGIDPAAAPLETDSEAGGAPLHSPLPTGGPAAGPARPSSANASSHADAMRAPEARRRESRLTGPLIALAIIVIVGALLIAIM